MQRFSMGGKHMLDLQKLLKKEFGFSPSFLKFMLNEIRYIGGEDMNDSCALGTTKQGMSKEVLYNVLVGKMCENEIPYNSSELERVYLCADRAYAGVKRYSGEEYVTHPVNVSILLTDMGAELNTIYAGMFCDAAKKGVMSLEQLKEQLPEEIVKVIIELEAFDFKRAEENSEQIVLIKLAERLHNMRTMEFMEKAEWKRQNGKDGQRKR